MYGGSVLLPLPLLHSNKCQILLEANIKAWNDSQISTKKLISPFLATPFYREQNRTLTLKQTFNAKSDFVKLLTDQVVVKVV